MGIKVYKPISNARRQMSIVDYSDLTKKAPEKSLIWVKKKMSGRNSYGKITCRHKGGGTRRFYRIVDFKRDKFEIPATVIALEYDPNRTARIALLQYRDGEKRYILAPVDLKVGDKLITSKNKVDIMPGNCSLLENIPVGTLLHNVELIPGKGGEIARSAGSWVKLMAIEGDFALLRMPSTEVRRVPKTNLATIGQVSNPEHMHVDIGKAGRKRHMGIKPTVRGKVMNPNDHPHGGGEARNSIGLKRPKTPWGKIALGGKTRKANKISDLLIVSRRKKNK